MQTFFFPGLDSVYYLVFEALNQQPRLLNALLSIPYGIAAFLVFSMARLFVGTRSIITDLLCAAVAVMGLTGAGGLPTIATTMSDIVPGLPFLVALTLWLHLEAKGRHNLRSSFALGLCAGVSVGLKLTLSPIFVGLFVAIALRGGLSRARAGALQAFVFGLGGLLTFAAIDASWLLGNWTTYGNPLFPFMNHVFKSDYADHSPWTDLRFMPRTLKMAVFYPAYWAFLTTNLAIELNMRDGRIMAGILGAIILLTSCLVYHLRNPKPSDRNGVISASIALAIVVLIAYGLWEKLWSIYRYLSVVETLTGVTLLAGLAQLASVWKKEHWAFLATAAVIVAIMTTTQYPWWSRAAKGDLALSVSLPAMEPDAMALFLDPYAYSYLVPTFPSTVKVVGANTNFIRPGSWGKMQAKAETAINGHQGPFWGFEYPEAFPGEADKTLAFYNLERDGECAPVVSNIDDRPLLRACHLKRK
ncbi:hypothetical protein FBZ89_101180 [Nitrospirillum amazonense]|uniref:Dolichyl-phosphate-mannose-protein mannosyltransferase n=2 Tax=Nitrospirillum amazonense TaxID=28077 RepID=A0A560FSE5_9PROT|nr:hypothetical protein FBZ89_101180 [Nitrospirillum amazonense]